MRFLMLNWRDPGNPLSGGAERVTLGYLAALVRRGHDVYWFANGFSGGAPSDEYEGVKVVRGGGIGISILKARSWVRQQAKFDLIIDQHHGIPWFAPWWSKTRTIAFIHEVLGPIWNSFYPQPLAAIGRIQERLMLGAYRSVPFWSACPSTEKGLRDLGVRDVTLIPYGVSTVPIQPFPEKCFEAPMRLVVVSRLAPNKRIDHAIEAVGVLRDRGRDVRLSIVGQGETKMSLTELIREKKLGHEVRFEGALDEREKDELLASSHVLLHSSVREGWGLNVIEANCMGTPAVVYPVPGLIESTINEETGLVAKEETPTALADEVDRLYNNPELYRNCRHAAWLRGSEFHWDRILPKACEWLEDQALRGRE